MCQKKEDDPMTDITEVPVPKSDFFSELMKLRQKWRIKKTGNAITGDLSYKSGKTLLLTIYLESEVIYLENLVGLFSTSPPFIHILIFHLPLVITIYEGRQGHAGPTESRKISQWAPKICLFVGSSILVALPLIGPST